LVLEHSEPKGFLTNNEFDEPSMVKNFQYVNPTRYFIIIEITSEHDIN